MEKERCSAKFYVLETVGTSGQQYARMKSTGGYVETTPSLDRAVTFTTVTEALDFVRSLTSDGVVRFTIKRVERLVPAPEYKVTEVE